MSPAFYLFILILILLILLFTLGYIIYINFIQPGAIYYPSKAPDIKKMLNLAQVDPKDTVLDFGSGDGCILLAAARRGAKAIGYEIDPLLVRQSRQAAKTAKLDHLITIHCQSMWHADFSSVTVVTLYLFPHFMNRLQKILDKKLNHPIKLVSNQYQFPDKKYTKKNGKIFLYHFK